MRSWDFTICVTGLMKCWQSLFGCFAGIMLWWFHLCGSVLPGRPSPRACCRAMTLHGYARSSTRSSLGGSDTQMTVMTEDTMPEATAQRVLVFTMEQLQTPVSCACCERSSEDRSQLSLCQRLTVRMITEVRSCAFPLVEWHQRYLCIGPITISMICTCLGARMAVVTCKSDGGSALVWA